jgi:hypothetical protein
MRRRIQAHLTLNITARQQEDPSTGKRGAARTGPTNELRSKNTRIVDRLPEYKLLTKDGRKIGGQPTERWMDGFNEHDGGIVQEEGKDGIVYKINYDNAYHLKYRLQQKGDVARDIVTQKYILGMRILMLGFERAYRSVKKRRNGGQADLARSINEFRLLAARGAGSTVLTLAEHLPKVIDKVAVTDAQNVE